MRGLVLGVDGEDGAFDTPEARAAVFSDGPPDPPEEVVAREDVREASSDEDVERPRVMRNPPPAKHGREG